MNHNLQQSATEMLDAPVKNPGGSTKTRRVLVVSYDFPPNRTSAVYRMTGLTRSLPQYGWQPTVLTIRGGDFAQEPALLEKLPPEVEIVRTKFMRINAWENKTASAIQGAGGLRSANSESSKPRRFDGFLRSAAALLRSTMYFPDDTVGWIPYALSRAIQLHRKNPFDVVWTTSPPRSAPVIGLLLKSLLGIPLVTEFMDPWWPQTRPFRRKSEEWLQARLLRKSDRVVVMVRQHAEEFMRSFKIPAEKLVVVRNGFFEEDFTAIEGLEPNDLDPAYFHLSHFGTIYPGNQGNFFVALAELLGEHPELKGQIRLHLVGFPCEDVLRYAQESELRDITKVHGFLPKREDTLQMMRSTDCLVVCWGRPDISQLAIAGKTYDYLRAGRPIIAVTGQGGGIEELVQQAQAGWVVPPHDTEGIKRVLRQIFSDLRKRRLHGPPRPDYVAQFRWDRLAEPLAQAFDDAAGHVA
jgi:glycosyltransferase involved in cell wall biosynthesis